MRVIVFWLCILGVIVNTRATPPNTQGTFLFSMPIIGDNLTTVLNTHNAERSLSCINNLTYDATLAAVAQTYSERCLMAHNMAFISQGNGENLAGTSWPSNPFGGWGGSASPRAEDGIIRWINEKAYHVCGSGKNPTEQDGHYTQVVNERTTKLGCGASKCNFIISGSAWDMLWLVCNYNPGQTPGNPFNPAKCGANGKCDQFTSVATGAPVTTTTQLPTASPSFAPTQQPTASPTQQPTVMPTQWPTFTPTPKPTMRPVSSTSACVRLKNACASVCNSTFFAFDDSRCVEDDGIIHDCVVSPGCNCMIPDELSSYGSIEVCRQDACVPWSSVGPGDPGWCNNCAYNCGGYRDDCIAHNQFCELSSRCADLDMCSRYQCERGNFTRCTTRSPTRAPTLAPTSAPTRGPIIVPTPPFRPPTYEPTLQPTSTTTLAPTTTTTIIVPTVRPTFEPTLQPTQSPTQQPTQSPTAQPTAAPTPKPKTGCAKMRDICWRACGQPDIFPFADQCVEDSVGKILTCVSSRVCNCPIPADMLSADAPIEGCLRQNCDGAFSNTEVGSAKWCQGCAHNCGSTQSKCLVNYGFCALDNRCASDDMCVDWRQKNCVNATDCGWRPPIPGDESEEWAGWQIGMMVMLVLTGVFILIGLLVYIWGNYRKYKVQAKAKAVVKAETRKREVIAALDDNAIEMEILRRPAIGAKILRGTMGDALRNTIATAYTGNNENVSPDIISLIKSLPNDPQYRNNVPSSPRREFQPVNFTAPNSTAINSPRRRSADNISRDVRVDVNEI